MIPIINFFMKGCTRFMSMLCVLIVSLGYITNVPIYGDLSSTHYRLSPTAMDSAGQSATGNSTSLVFQSVAPFVTGIVTSNESLLVNGTHFSSVVVTLNGYALPFDRLAIPLVVETEGLFSIKTEFRAKETDETLVLFSSSIDDDPEDGFSITWNSEETLIEETQVTLQSRVHDGLTWGAWFETTDAPVIDNNPPELHLSSVGPTPFSPNNDTSIGIKDSSFFDLSITEVYLSTWNITFLTPSYDIERKIVGNESDLADPIEWDGRNTTGNFSSDGTYIYEVSARDLVGNITTLNGTVVVDNTSPIVDRVALSVAAKALNSGKGDLSSTWVASDNIDTALSYSLAYSFTDTNPRQLSDLLFWFDASSTSNMDSVGSFVDEWDELGYFHYNASQSTSDNQPRITSDNAGYTSLYFDGNDVMTIDLFQYLSTDTVASVSIIVVAKSTETSAQSLVSFSDDMWELNLSNSLGNPEFLTAASSKNSLTSGAITDGQFHIMTGVFDVNASTQKVLYIDGAEQTSVADPHSGQPVGSLTLNQMGTIGDYLVGSIGEIVVFNRALSEAELDSMHFYLGEKWGLSSNFDTQFTKQAISTWSATNVDDNSYYTVQIIAEDDAGNTDTRVSNTVFAPDRTAPVISSEFTEIVGTEDVDFVMDPSLFKSDTYFVKDELTWEAEVYTQAESPVKSSEEIIADVSVVSQNLEFSFVLQENANTDPDVDPAYDGNIYGKEQAWIKVTLYDQNGNFVEKDIQMMIEPVNDPPLILSEIGLNILKDGNNRTVYNIKFDEDTTHNSIVLDDFINDVDNLKSDLVWTISGNSFEEITDFGFDGSSFMTDYPYVMTVRIGDDLDEHELYIIPTQNYWGDDTFVIQVQDPDLATATQNFISRVWPVNDPPLISDDIPLLVTATEDNTIVLSLTPYENDVYLEDEAPTYNALLKWSIQNSEGTIIETIDGALSIDDIMTLYPEENAYGTVNVVLTLTDTDTLPQSTYTGAETGGGYTPNPKSTTRNLTLVWYPINDAPVIASSGGDPVPNQEEDEDADEWSLDLSSYMSDIEDLDSNLTWEVSFNNLEIVSYTLDTESYVLYFTPSTNAWGTSNIILSLSDEDQSIDFEPYTPNPITVTQSIVFTLNPINDIPILDRITMLGRYSSNLASVLSSDTITVTSIGYSDVGYDNDVRESLPYKDEYDASRQGDLGFDTNSKLYSYRWYVNGALITSVSQSSIPTASFIVDDSIEGDTVTVEVWPDDGIFTGAVLTKSMKVNNRPYRVDESTVSPVSDSYTNTGNVTVSWGSVTDDDVVDVNNIGYRAKVWKVDKWGTPPEDMDIDNSDTYYDSGWHFNLTSFDQTDLGHQYEHGTYYWKVWTGNQYNTDVWDSRDPDWVGHFTVDLISPEQLDFEDYVQVNELGQNAVVGDAGNTRVLYGTKPEDLDDDTAYQIILSWINEVIDSEGNPVITTGNEIIVPLTTSSDWTYMISYPDGTTTYNIIIQDRAGNNGTSFSDPELLFTFTIIDDLIPPVPFEITVDDVSSVYTLFEDITSQNMYYLSGIKESESAIFYSGYSSLLEEEDDSQIVGFTSAENFSLFIYPAKPSGNLYSIDRSGNVAIQSTDIEIEFLIGAPTLSSVNISQTYINSPENESELLASGVSQVLVDSVMTATVNFQSNRITSKYQLSSNDTILVSGNIIAADTLTSIALNGGMDGLVQGSNTVTLSVWDRALNQATSTVQLVVLKEDPSTDIVNIGSEITKLSLDDDQWLLKVYGEQVDNVVVQVNGNAVVTNNNGTWHYFDSNFNPETTDVTLYVQDRVYNDATSTLWDKSYYSEYEAEGITDITLPALDVDIAPKYMDESIILTYSGLPYGISSLDSTPVSRQSLTLKRAVSAQVLSSVESIHDKTESGIGSIVKQEIHHVYGRNSNARIEDDVDLSDSNVMIGIPIPNTIEDPSVLRIVMYDTEKKDWVMVNQAQYIDSYEHKIVTTVLKTGIYAIAEADSFEADLSQVRQYPNPWRPHDGRVETGTLEGGITFDRLSNDARIRIYTISGKLVADETPGTSTWIWDGKNTSNDDVFSGVYLYIITDGNNVKKGKLTIIR